MQNPVQRRAVKKRTRGHRRVKPFTRGKEDQNKIVPLALNSPSRLPPGVRHR
jgi:hypothetical protein